MAKLNTKKIKKNKLLLLLLSLLLLSLLLYCIECNIKGMLSSIAIYTYKIRDETFKIYLYFDSYKFSRD